MNMHFSKPLRQTLIPARKIDMKMKQLYTFRVVCEEESITKAAERLSTTQPAISRTISELEDSVGVRLFDRSSRKVVLNETGQLFLSKVIPLLELYEDLENTFQDNGSMSVLRLALLRLLSIPFCLEY
ncbi:LysR family transcriptional regulator [Clostridium sp. AM58-1XD]|nr:LysR family transcriptional regulator [Clostridium sp. AM58-1XD]